MTSKANDHKDQSHVRFTLDAVIDLNGEDEEYIGQRMNSAFARAIADGALTGDTGATVDVYTAQTTTLTPKAAALSEDDLAAWLSHQIESGAMPLEGLARLMARYALTDPADMREEFVERMGLEEDGGDRFPDVPRSAA